MPSAIETLRTEWAELWGEQPHPNLGQTMLRKGIKYKRWEIEVGGAPAHIQKHLNKLIKQYKQSPNNLTDCEKALKPGTRLVRTYHGKKHQVVVGEDGFSYAGKEWKSLSQIANHITGSRWNGWVFFGIKKAGAK